MKAALPYPYAAQDVRRVTPPVVPPRPAEPGWAEQLEKWMVHHPGACAAAAIAIGVTLGWLIKRR